MSKKKKRQKNLKTDEQQEYVDSNRRIAVSFDSKELSRAFKNFNKIHVCSTLYVKASIDACEIPSTYCRTMRK